MEERYVTYTSIPAKAVIAWADAAWAESQPGGANPGFAGARGDSPFALSRLDSYRTAKLPPQFYSWVDISSQSPHNRDEA